MQWNKTPENNLTNRKEELLHFASIIPAPRIILLNIKREFSVQKEFSLRKEESGVSYQLSQTFGAPHKGPTSVSLHSGIGKAEMYRWLGTRNKGMGRQYQTHREYDCGFP